MSDAASSLRDHFLIALPTLGEGIFAHSIIYICEHDENGAMGIIINRPLDVQVDEILEQLDFDHQSGEHPQAVYAGGPVHTDRGFVLHRRDSQQWESSIEVNNDIALTTSLDILDAIANNRGPSQNLIALGYAGWEGGQLEQELQDNAWLTLPARDEILFDVAPEQRVDAALAQLGISFAQLGSDSGHA
jgi:putative transcriptional regulator